MVRGFYLLGTSRRNTAIRIDLYRNVLCVYVVLGLQDLLRLRLHAARGGDAVDRDCLRCDCWRLFPSQCRGLQMVLPFLRNAKLTTTGTGLRLVSAHRLGSTFTCMRSITSFGAQSSHRIACQATNVFQDVRLVSNNILFWILGNHVRWFGDYRRRYCILGRSSVCSSHLRDSQNRLIIVNIP